MSDHRSRPAVTPIYIDAKAFCPHIPPEQFPGQAVAFADCIAHGRRARRCEIGSVMFGGGGHSPPEMELVRLAIPRRVYTQSHIDYVIEVALELRMRADEIPGMRIVEEQDALRHFTARFEPLDHAVTVPVGGTPTSRPRA